MLEPWALGHKRLKKKLAWWFYQNKDLQSASALHATAKAEALQLEQLGFTCPVFTHPNGVQVPMQFRNGACFVPDSIEEPKTVLFLSRVHPKKGLHLCPPDKQDNHQDTMQDYTTDKLTAQSKRHCYSGWVLG